MNRQPCYSAVLALLLITTFGVGAASAASPTVSVEAVTGVGVSAAFGHAKVTTGGKETSCHFEVISDSLYDENVANSLDPFAGAGQTGFCSVEAGAPSGTPVEPVLEGLQPGTEYHLRFAASNEDSVNSTEPEVFAVGPNFSTQVATPPTVTIDPATEASYTSAHVSGAVDPEGGNQNPAAGGTVPIGWELQYSSDPAELGWWAWSAGTIEAPVSGESNPVPVEATLEGLSNATEYQFRLVAYYAGQTAESPAGAFTTLTVSKPVVEAEDASLVTATTAHFSGKVTAGNADPAFDASCFFDFVPDPQFQLDGYAQARSVACDPNPVTGVAATAVVADPTGLLPGTEYHLRLRATNQGGEETDEASIFLSESTRPKVANLTASDVGSSTATVRASVNPDGAPTTYHFEYLTQGRYEANGNSFAGAAATLEAAVGGDASFHVVQAGLSGLEPGTEYRFRVVAMNTGGQASSSIGSLRTSGAESCPTAAVRAQQGSTYLPDCRAFEIVNSPGLDINEVQRVVAISDDGEQVGYMSQVAGNDALGSAELATGVARRTPQGWVRENADLASERALAATTASSFASSFSPDFSKVLMLSNLPATPADEDDQFDAYVLQTGTGKGTLMTFEGEGIPSQLIGGATDLSRIVFRVQGNSSIPDGLYLSDGTSMELVSRLPNGEPAVGALTTYAGAAFQRGLFVDDERNLNPWVERGGNHAVSDDARRIFFYDQFLSALGGGHLFLRDLTGPVPKTIEISKSQRSGELGAPQNAMFISASPDGSAVYFFSQSKLTDDANWGGGIYRFELANESLTLLTPDRPNQPNEPLGAAITSADESHVYFTSTNALTDEAAAGDNNAYVWSESGGTHFIARVDPGDKIERVSQNGRYALLVSTRSLGGAPTAGHREIYLYDDDSGDLVCASCREDGSASEGDAYLHAESIGFPSFQGGTSHPRNLSGSGQVFFDSTDRLIARDQTSAMDVYEFHRGQLGLLSPGNTDTISFLGENSDNGNHAFVITRSPLVGADRDAAGFDIYDAHTDGGFLEPPPPAAPCEGEGCRGAATSGPTSLGAATSVLSGAGNPKPRCAKRKVRRHGKCVKKKRRQHRHRHHRRPTKGGKR